MLKTFYNGLIKIQHVQTHWLLKRLNVFHFKTSPLKICMNLFLVCVKLEELKIIMSSLVLL